MSVGGTSDHGCERTPRADCDRAAEVYGECGGRARRAARRAGGRNSFHDPDRTARTYALFVFWFARTLPSMKYTYQAKSGLPMYDVEVQ